MKRLLLLVVLVAGCDARIRTLDIGFGENLEGLSGFQCVQEADITRPLVARAVSGSAFLDPNLVVDLIEVGEGIPSCRAAQILSWCATRDCHPAEGRRVTQVLDLSGIDPADPTAIEQVFARAAELDGRRIFDDVPSGRPLMLRVVGTVQDQAEFDATDGAGRYVPFDNTKLLGAAYSCPLVLSAASGELFLGFDALNDRCEPGVIIAAGDF